MTALDYALTQLDAKLSDGEPDYQIALTDAGREFMARGQAFPYRDMDL